MDRNEYLSVRITAKLKDALQRAAQADQRSMSSLALVVLTQWLKAQGYLK